MAKANKKEVVLTVGEAELRFAVGINEFNGLQNEMLPNNKVAPSENFLVKCVHPDDKEKMLDYCDQGFAIDMASMVAEQFKPEVVISVKK
jgi:hypothetical protein